MGWGSDQTLVATLNVFYASDALVKIEGCFFLERMLDFNGQVRIGGPWNFLIWDRDLFRCALNDIFKLALRILGFAFGNTRPNLLAGQRILNEHHKRSAFSFQPRYAFASMGDVLDVQREDFVFSK